MRAMNKKDYFISIFKKAEKKYKKNTKRLAAEGWTHGWQVLIATIMSAQSRDETTIPIAENLFKKYPTLEKLAKAKYADVLKILSGMNYNRTKSKHVIEAAQYILKEFKGIVPSDIELLIKIPGVGRKTANLVVTEVFSLPGICVDTHVHRISNVFEFVQTKTPDQTEIQLKSYVPQKYWKDINRYFVLWGKDCPSKDKEVLLASLGEKSKQK